MPSFGVSAASNGSSPGNINVRVEIPDIRDAILYVIGSYVMPVVVCLGAVNNIIILVIMSSARYRNIVSCFYLRFLAVSDTLTLATAAQMFVTDAFATLATMFGNGYCAQLLFFAYFPTNLSNWTLVVMTLTRFIAVVFPLHAARWCSMKIAKVEVVVMAIIFGIFASPNAIYGRRATIDESKLQFSCYKAFSVKFAFIYSISHSTICQIVPFVLIVIFNLCIVYKMRHRKCDLGDLVVAKQQSKDETMVTVMVIVVTVTFLILVAPYVATVVIWEFIYANADLSASMMKRRYFSYYISGLLYSVNNSINLYLYCICGKRFRNDLKELFCFRCNKKN
jgi:hypothetical protein